MSQVVLDASALLAFLQTETGAEKVEAVIDHSCISTVNWCEVLQKCVKHGVQTETMQGEFESLGLRIISFTTEQAEIAGKLVNETKHLGLSLGDRACLSLGLSLNLPVFTSDKEWAKLPETFQIHLVR